MEIVSLSIGVLVVALLILLILKEWKYGIPLIFGWWLIGDFIRKIVPGQPPELMLVGDFLIAVTYISFLFYLLSNKKSLWLPPFLGSLLAYIGYSVINVFNPHSFNFLVGAVGLRSYLWFIPLMFVAYEYFNNHSRVLSFLKKITYASPVLFITAVLQLTLSNSKLPPFLKPFQGGHQIHSFGMVSTGIVQKIVSLFGSAQRFGMIVLFLFVVSLGLYYYFVLQKKKSKTRIFLVFSILNFISIVLSASRSAFVLALLGFLIITYFLAQYSKEHILFQRFKNIIQKRNKLIILTATALFMLFLLGLNVGLFQLTSVYEVFSKTLPRVIHEATATIENAPIFGYGTGVFSQGLDYINGKSIAQRIPQEIRYATGERGFKRSFFELGILGGIIFFLFWFRIFASIKLKIKDIHDYKFRILFISIALFPLLTLIRYTFVHYEVLSDYAVLIPLWFSIGLLFKIPKLSTNN